MTMWFVKKSEILSYIPYDKLEDTLKIFSPHQPVKKGTIIFQPTEPSEFVYLIKKGSVQLTRLADNGQQITLSILTEGMIFGEADVLNESTYSHFAETLESSNICYIRKDDFKNLLAKHTELVSMILNILYRRLKEAQTQIEFLAFHDVRDRLVSILLRFSKDYGSQYDKKGINGTVINFKISQEKLADFCGTSRESINRNIKEMKEEGLLELEGRNIVLLNSFFNLYSADRLIG